MNPRRLKKLREPHPATDATDTDNTVQTTDEKDPGQADARDFLDRRDEARISHRLGRNFRF